MLGTASSEVIANPPPDPPLMRFDDVRNTRAARKRARCRSFFHQFADLKQNSMPHFIRQCDLHALNSQMSLYCMPTCMRWVANSPHSRHNILSSDIAIFMASRFDVHVNSEPYIFLRARVLGWERWSSDYRFFRNKSQMQTLERLIRLKWNM